jgi:hypothetical protein
MVSVLSDLYDLPILDADIGIGIILVFSILLCRYVHKGKYGFRAL